MEIPNHQRQTHELTAEEIIDDKYVIIFFFIFVARQKLRRCKSDT